MLSQSSQSSLPTLLATMTPPHEADDATLVHKLVDEHPHAARLIWQRFAPMVHGILRQSFGPDDAVEDLAQEVLTGPGQLVSNQHIESREALRRFLFILDRINVQDRTAFALRFVEGMPIESVATALDVSVATAKRRVSRARSRVALLAARDSALVEYLSCSRCDTG